MLFYLYLSGKVGLYQSPGKAGAQRFPALAAFPDDGGRAQAFHHPPPGAAGEEKPGTAAGIAKGAMALPDAFRAVHFRRAAPAFPAGKRGLKQEKGA